MSTAVCGLIALKPFSHLEVAIDLKDWHMEKTKRNLLLIFGAIGIFATVLSNISNINTHISALVSNVSRYKFENPIISNIIINNPAPSEYISESLKSSIDVTLSYEGEETLVIDTIEIQHFIGMGSSVSTGPIVPSGDYVFTFNYGKYSKYNISPKLVINPKDTGLINFIITLVPEGDFHSVGGVVYALIGYQDGKGKKGVIPLISKVNAEGGEVIFPYLFDGDPYKSEIKHVSFVVNKFGAIEGMSREYYDLIKHASGRKDAAALDANF
tara:strand:- start:3838 stop:4647 length:810 start_codon:yes stop_codon:yes gene_type:complete